MFIKKGDAVLVLSGKDKGKQGKILKLFPNDKKVIVEKINFSKRHTKPTNEQRQGGIVEKEAPFSVAKVQVVCSKCSKPTRVGHRFLSDGAKVRVCKKCGEMMDKI